MSETTEHFNEIDAYIADLADAERQELEAADVAIDLAFLLYRARERRNLTQAGAARRAGLHQQAVSRIERPKANLQLLTLLRYLKALNYGLLFTLIDRQTGEVVAQVGGETSTTVEQAGSETVAAGVDDRSPPPDATERRRRAVERFLWQEVENPDLYWRVVERLGKKEAFWQLLEQTDPDLLWRVAARLREPDLFLDYATQVSNPDLLVRWAVSITDSELVDGWAAQVSDPDEFREWVAGLAWSAVTGGADGADTMARAAERSAGEQQE